MILGYIKSKQKYFSMAVMGLASVLAVATISKAAVSMVRVRNIAPAIESAKANTVVDTETSKKHLAKFKESAEKLKKENMYDPSQAKPKPPTCTGIIGSRAIINGKGYKVGESVSGAELISIGTKDVTVMWEGKETVLPIFSKAGGSSGSSQVPVRPQSGIKRVPTNTVTPVRTAAQRAAFGARKQDHKQNFTPAQKRAQAARAAAMRAQSARSANESEARKKAKKNSRRQ